MTALTTAVGDSATTLQRNLRHTQRYPSLTLMPIVLLLLFVYVLRGTMGAGLDGVTGGRQHYRAYVAPGRRGRCRPACDGSPTVSRSPR